MSSTGEPPFRFKRRKLGQWPAFNLFVGPSHHLGWIWNEKRASMPESILLRATTVNGSSSKPVDSQQDDLLYPCWISKAEDMTARIERLIGESASFESAPVKGLV